VLLAGGWSGPFAQQPSLELFDPATETFAAIDADGTLNMAISRARHTATELSDGRVLFAGGQWTGGPSLATHGELYVPPAAIGQSATIGLAGAHVVPRVEHSATLLSDGRVLIAGGFDHTTWDNDSTATTEFWSPGTLQFSAGGNLATGRADHRTSALGFGYVIMSGGASAGVAPRTIERFPYDDVVGATPTTVPQGSLAVPYDYTLQGSGSGEHTFELAWGSLPPGLTLDLNGRLHGTPSTLGTFRFTVLVTEIASGLSGYQTLTITVGNSLRVTREIVHAIVGEPLDHALATTGGTAPLAWTIDEHSPALPPGVGFSADGRLYSDAPAGAGHFTLEVRVGDSHPTLSQSVSHRVRLSVADIDQRQLVASANVIAGGLPQSQVIAQTVTAGVTGTIAGIRLPIACSAGGTGNQLYIEIRDVVNGQPTDQVLVSQSYQALAAFPSPQAWRTIRFTTPFFMRGGDRFAIFVFTDGNCSLGVSPEGEHYGGGQLFTSVPASYTNIPWQAAGRDLAFHTLVEPVRFANFGAAAVDGLLTDEEWNSAGQMHFSVNVPGGGSTPGTLMVMNDESDVFIGVVYERDEADLNAYVNINSDRDNNGATYQIGDDLWSVNSDGISSWNLWDAVGVGGACAPPQACRWEGDHFVGGRQDGTGAGRRSGETFALEVSHPFNSGDTNDIAVDVNERFGFHINMGIYGAQNVAAAQTFIPAINHTTTPIAIVPASGSIAEIRVSGGEAAQAMAINNQGHVVGSFATTESHAFIHRDGVGTDLHLHIGGSYSLASDINDHGVVVGRNPSTGFAWVSGAAQDLGHLGGGSTEPQGVNNAGDIVGSSRIVGGAVHAFLYRGGSMIDLHQMGTRTEAFDISNTGYVTGIYETGGVTRSFILPVGATPGQMTDMSTLGGTTTEARAVNDAGVVVGRSSLSSGVMQAFKYSNGVMSGLGTLVQGQPSAAHDINALGMVVGESAGRAVLFRNFDVIDLNTLIPSGPWVLQVATSINDGGQITATGTLNGQPASFIVTVPH
jgi:probable HAF family extracellular repeat protein